MLTRINSDIMQPISVYSVITIAVFLNSNKNSNNICFQFTPKYIFSVCKT